MYNIAIFASGSGSNALEIINYFKKSSLARISVVISNREKAGVRQHAVENHIDFQYFEKTVWKNNPENILAGLREKQIDLIVLAGFLLLIPKALITEFPNRILNIHPALLPNFGGKGMYGHHVHEAVKASAKSESGMTIHLVNENFDEGEILFQAKTAISSSDDAETIQKKVLKLEHEWYPKIIEKFLKERMNP